MSEIPSWEQMLSPGGEIPPGYEPSSEETSDVAALHGLYESFSTEGFTAAEISAMRAAGLLLLPNEPQLLTPDQQLISNFLSNLDKLKATDPPPTIGPYLRTENGWLKPAAVVYLFMITATIIKLLSRIKRLEAVLQISLAETRIEIARELHDLTIAIGKIASEMCLIEAGKAITDFALAIAQIAMTTSIMMVKNSAQNRIRNDSTISDSERIQQLQDMRFKFESIKSITDLGAQGIKSVITAAFEIQKSELELLKAESEADKQLLQTLVQGLADTIDALKSGRSDAEKQIEALIQNLQSAFRTYGEQFHA